MINVESSVPVDSWGCWCSRKLIIVVVVVVDVVVDLNIGAKSLNNEPDEVHQQLCSRNVTQNSQEQETPVDHTRSFYQCHDCSTLKLSSNIKSISISIAFPGIVLLCKIVNGP